MNPVRRRLLPIVFAALGAAACGASGQTASSAHEQIIQGPHLAAGTLIHVQLERPLDLSSSAPGAAFVAAVSEDVHTEHGDTLIAAGALVRGTIHWGAHSGRIYLSHGQVQSLIGPAELHATIEVPSATPEAGHEVSARTGSASTLAREEGTAPAAWNRAVLSQGQVLTLTLTQPMLAPGARVLVP